MRLGVLLSVISGVVFAARAEEEGRGQLQGEIVELLNKYQAALIRGDADQDLGEFLKQIRKAEKGGDWDRVAQLLADYNRKKLERVDDDSSSATVEEKEPEVKYGTSRERYASGELGIAAVFYEPTVAGSKSPGVVLVHDGVRGVRSHIASLAEELAKGGYAVYLPYLRGQVGSDGKIEFLGGEVDDVVNAVKVLKSKESVKESEVSIVGVGDGGALAFLAANKLGNQIKYAVGISPLTDLVSLFRSSTKWKLDVRRLGLDWSVEDKEELLSRSPVRQVMGIEAKILAMHGKLDDRVPVSQAEGYCAILDHRGRSYEIKIYDATGWDLVRQRRVYADDLKNFLKTGTTKAAKKKAKSEQPGGAEGGGEQPVGRRGRREG